MKFRLLCGLLAPLLLFSACAAGTSASGSPALTLTKEAANVQLASESDHTIYLAGGCFWASVLPPIQARIYLPGHDTYI